MMHRATTLLFAALVFALACSGSTTPTTPGGTGSPSAPTATLPAELDITEAEIDAAAGMPGLDEEQRAAIRAAYAAAREALSEIRAQLVAGEITLLEAFAAARLIHAELFATVQAILPDRPEPPQDLELTREQLGQLIALRLETLAFLRELYGRVASGELTAEEARAAFQVHLQESNRQMCAILTAEQQAKTLTCSG